MKPEWLNPIETRHYESEVLDYQFREVHSRYGWLSGRVPPLRPAPLRPVRLAWVAKGEYGYNPYSPRFRAGQTNRPVPFKRGGSDSSRDESQDESGRGEYTPDPPLIFFKPLFYLWLWEGKINGWTLYWFFFFNPRQLKNEPLWVSQRVSRGTLWLTHNGSETTTLFWVVVYPN